LGQAAGFHGTEEAGRALWRTAHRHPDIAGLPMSGDSAHQEGRTRPIAIQLDQ
jgi:hypothetical protein